MKKHKKIPREYFLTEGEMNYLEEFLFDGLLLDFEKGVGFKVVLNNPPIPGYRIRFKKGGKI
jgi:hypothetical protein